MIDNERQKHIHKILTKILAGWLILFLVVGGLVIFGQTIAADEKSFVGAVLSGGMRGLSSVAPVITTVPLTEAPTQMVRETTNTLWTKAKAIFKTLSAVAFKNAIKNMTARVAQRTAEQLASGMTGQKPAFETNIGQFVKDEADGALGDYLNNTVGKMWGKDLCEPLNPLVKVNLEVMAKKLVVGERPSCSFSKITKNIESLKELKTSELVQFSTYFDPASNDLGTLLTITSGALETKKANEELAKFTKLVEGPYRSLTNPITDEIKTPAAFYGGLALGSIDNSLIPYGIYTGEAVADAIGVFTNTLTSKLLDHYLKKGIYQGNRSTGGGGAYAPAYGDTGVQAVREQFADLGKPDYSLTGGSMVDVLSELGCGSESQYACTINDGMRSAIEQKMTVRQALTAGLLNGDWVVGFASSEDSGTRDIKNNVYSYRTLLILRKYRIIPVGWELAAQYYKQFDKNPSSQPLTLNRLIAESSDENSPYYKLVDENWVLKLPETICDKEGPGEETEAETVDMSVDLDNNGEIDANERREMVVRKTYCADERSCIQEGKDGKTCDYYGYCTKEKPIWRIGQGECDAQYNSCQTFTDSEGNSVSYLKNTLFGLDGVCNNTNDVGCREYCLTEDKTSGAWKCQLGQNTDPTSAAYMGRRTYLNKKASSQECSEDQAGCSQFIRMSSDLAQASNWIPNSSFDYVKTDKAGFLVTDNNTDFVTFSGGGSLVDSTNSYALALTGDLGISVDTGRALGGRVFNFSLKQKNSATEINFSTTGSGGRITKLGVVDLGDGWFRSNWKYDFLESKNNSAEIITITIPADTIDDLQLSEANEFKTYQAYGATNNVSLKKAPVDYGCDLYSRVIDGVDKTGCTGGTRVWRADIERCVEGGSERCNNYALTCVPEDVGCRSYEPISYLGVNQPGVISAADLCPKECVGYESYLEQPTYFEPITAMPANRNPVSLIPASAKTCNASEAGCEEFTNLSQGAEGERKEYYTALRACVVPDENNAQIRSYYSWASSSESGNQLRNWTLLASNLDGGAYPCTNPVTSADGAVSCQDASGTAGTCTLGSPIMSDNPAYNPDCVEFINTNNVATWVKFSRVVFASDECVKLRRTYVPAGVSGQQIYSAIPSLSQTCSSAAVGCREYKGSASNNVDVLLEDNFDDKREQGWIGGSPDPESIIANGGSLFANGTISKDVSAMVETGKSYKLYFWAKAAGGSATLTASFSGNLPLAVNQQTSQVTLNRDWNKYVMNLNNFNRAVEATETLQIAGSGYFIDNIVLMETKSDLYLIKNTWQTPAVCDEPAVGAEIGCEAYKDKDGQEWYAKSFSKICYDYAVGCEQMIDTHNSLAPYEEEYNNDPPNTDTRDDVVVSADNLAYLVYDEDKTCNEVGCTRLGLMTIDQSMSKINFSDKYFIVDPNNFKGLAGELCLAKSAGCDEFSPVGEKASGKIYFKDPGALVCEYKLAGTRYGWYKKGTTEPCPGFSANPASGVCSNELTRSCLVDTECSGAPCLIDRHCVGGRSTEDANALNNVCGDNVQCMNYSTGSDNDGICSSWVAMCPEESNTCSEYQDPNNPENCDRSLINYERGYANGKLVPHCDYYYYKTDELSTCGRVDPSQGCLGFHETYGGVDDKYSFWRCANSPLIRCEDNTDCPIINGKYDRCEGQPVQAPYTPVY